MSIVSFIAGAATVVVLQNVNFPQFMICYDNHIKPFVYKFARKHLCPHPQNKPNEQNPKTD
jgi:hypothetical protein